MGACSNTFFGAPYECGPQKGPDNITHPAQGCIKGLAGMRKLTYFHNFPKYLNFIFIYFKYDENWGRN